LRFYQELGTARLRLEMRDRTVEVDATALQAAVIEAMEGREEATAEELAETLEVSDGEVRSALVFWADEGIIDEDGGVWRVIE
jgi:anaphase-promoting complex subunit 2